MKRKEVFSKEQATLEKRRRRSNLEILRLPTGAMRLMKDIAGAADLPVDRVFKDVIEAGLAVIRNPESSPYESMIQFRKTLHEKDRQNTGMEISARGVNDDSTQRDDGHDRPGSTNGPTGNREMAKTINGPVNPENIDDELGFIDNSKRSGDADEQSRRATETESGDRIPELGLNPEFLDLAKSSSGDDLEYVP